jgi:hypothetical protein
VASRQVNIPPKRIITYVASIDMKIVNANLDCQKIRATAAKTIQAQPNWGIVLNQLAEF